MKKGKQVLKSSVRGASTYTPDQLAVELGVCRRTVYLGLKQNKIPALKLGKRYIISREAIATWMRTNGGQFAV